MLYNDDCIKVMKKLKSKSIDMIFADPPYFLSNGGQSIKNGKVVSVNKGEWDKKENYEDVDTFTYNWISECYRLLKEGGTIFISGTQHNIFDIREALLKAKFNILNIIIWHKTDPPPLIYKIRFRYSYEFIIFASKGFIKTFNYQDMYKVNGYEMDDVWDLPAVSMDEKKFGYHPTQKPEILLERIIKCSTNVNDVVLDPFMGSGTTCAVAKRLNRQFIGIEKEEEYYNIAKDRTG